MRSVILNGLYMEEPENAHAYLKRMLNLPDYYGNNLDALHDCLTELEGVQIELIYGEGRGAYFQKLMRVFKDAGRANDRIRIIR